MPKKCATSGCRRQPKPDYNYCPDCLQELLDKSIWTRQYPLSQLLADRARMAQQKPSYSTIRCQRCLGKGWYTSYCPICEGSGYIEAAKDM